MLILTILTSCTNSSGVVSKTSEPAFTEWTSAPTATMTISVVERLLAAHLAGESIDVSQLSPAEFGAFSTQLADKRNAERGINPIIYNNEAFISPETYRMTPYDGHPDQNETIQMYLPVVGKDSAGNLQILNQDGQTITITNSADVDWNMVVTDPNDPRIDWPTTKVLDSGFVEAQYRVYYPENPTNLLPAILLDNSSGNIFLEGEKQDLEVNYRFVIIETDDQKNPILVREILVIGSPTFNLYAEGTPIKEIGSPWNEKEYSSFYKNLEINHVYYIGGQSDQDRAYLEIKKCSPQNYSGIIVGNDVYAIFLNQLKNDNDMIVLAASVFLKKQ